MTSNVDDSPLVLYQIMKLPCIVLSLKALQVAAWAVNDSQTVKTNNFVRNANTVRGIWKFCWSLF